MNAILLIFAAKLLTYEKTDLHPIAALCNTVPNFRTKRHQGRRNIGTPYRASLRQLASDLQKPRFEPGFKRRKLYLQHWQPWFCHNRRQHRPAARFGMVRPRPFPRIGERPREFRRLDPALFRHDRVRRGQRHHARSENPT